MQYILPFIFIVAGIVFLYFRDYSMLLLNRYSNNFGTSWVRGVIFTLGMGLMTNIPILIYSYQDIYFNPTFAGFGDFFQNLVEIMNVTKWDNFKLLENISGWQYVWLFIGRIFIGYGIYQTIQAFRKYGK